MLSAAEESEACIDVAVHSTTGECQRAEAAYAPRGVARPKATLAMAWGVTLNFFVDCSYFMYYFTLLVLWHEAGLGRCYILATLLVVVARYLIRTQGKGIASVRDKASAFTKFWQDQR